MLLPVPNTSSSTPGYDASVLEPVAITGMAIDLPGGVDSPSTLWKLLEEGLNTCTEIPRTRFDISEHINDNATGRRMVTTFGNFIDDADVFDNAFFSISPREAMEMSPMQRVLMRVSYKAIEDAGYVPYATPSFDPETFGVYVGAAIHDYGLNMREDIDVYYATGTLPAFLSGKVSYAFGFEGPSVVVDTACSSGAVAIQQAVRALQNGDCNAAIAGGVNVFTNPDMYVMLDRAHFLSPTGQCKPWDASADGYCRGEGCGMFVLKRMSDAVREGDRILGVIRGAEINQAGKAVSITRPHGSSQVQLFETLLRRSGVSRHQVDVIEAHGTGTQAGDPIELQSLRSVFGQGRTAATPLHVTSIKANIGHAEAASGAASLAKLLMMFKHRSIPRCISLKTLNPRIPSLDVDHTVIDTAQVPWNTDGYLRTGVLNNFGAAGSNCALVVQEPPTTERAAVPVAGTVIFGMSCKTADAAERLRAAYLEHLEAHVHGQDDLTDFAYTSTARRLLYAHRISVAASSKQDLLDKLRNAALVNAAPLQGKIVWVFSGQGTQYLGMASQLYRTSSQFRRTVDDCHTLLIAQGLPGVVEVITGQDDELNEHLKTRAAAFQTAIFVVECALAHLWTSWGFHPDAVIGHSLGEYSALVVAGVLNMNDALLLVARRAKYMIEMCPAGVTGMMAIKLGPDDVKDLLRKHPDCDGISVACVNGRTDLVLGGPLVSLERLKAACSPAGIKSRVLEVAYACHTEAMLPIVAPLTAFAEGIQLSAPKIPISSSVLGALIQPGDDTVISPAYFANNAMQTVLFQPAVDALLADPNFSLVDAWIEIGPHPALIPMLRSNLPREYTRHLLPCLRKGNDDWEIMSATLSVLYTLGVPVDWRCVYSDMAPAACCVSLPSYPFAQTRFWIQYKEPQYLSTLNSPATIPTPPPVQETEISTLSPIQVLQRPSSDNGYVAVAQSPISGLRIMFNAHQVAGVGLCPASVFHELAIEAAELTSRRAAEPRSHVFYQIADVAYSIPLVDNGDISRQLRIEVRWKDSSKSEASFVFSTPAASGAVQAHCTGTLVQRNIRSAVAEWRPEVGHSLARQKALTSSIDSIPPENFHTHTLYRVFFPSVVDYSEVFHAIRSITVNATNTEAFAIARLPDDAVQGGPLMNVVFADTVVHAAGFAVNRLVRHNDAFICCGIESVDIISSRVDPRATYGIFCKIKHLPRGSICEAFAFELDNGGQPVAWVKGINFKKLRMDVFKGTLARMGTSPTTVKTPIPQSAVPNSISAPTPPSMTDSDDSASNLSLSLTCSPDSGCMKVLPDPEIHDKLVEILSSQLGMHASQLPVDKYLCDLGLDSLMTIELADALRSAFPSIKEEQLLTLDEMSVTELVSSVRRSMAQAGSMGVALVPPDPVSVKSIITNGHALQSVTPSTSNVNVPEILSSILGIPAGDIRPGDDLEALGMDSLSSIELLHTLHNQLPSLPSGILETCTTVTELEQAISSAFLTSSAKVNAYANHTAPPPILPEPILSVKPEVYASVTPPPLGQPLTFPTAGVTNVLATILGIAPRDIRPEDDLEALGLDSLSSIELLHELHSKTSVPLPQDILATCATVGELDAAIASLVRPQTIQRAPSSMDGRNNPLLLQDGDRNAHPLFLIHDGSGLVTHYSKLQALGRRVYGIYNPKFSSGEEWPGGLNEIAQFYAGYIKKTDTGSTCLIGGWSFGGVLAFEIARRLIVDGFRVPGVIAIDSPPPTRSSTIPKEILDEITEAVITNPSTRERVRTQFEHLGKILVSYDPYRSPVAHITPKVILLRSREDVRIEQLKKYPRDFLVNRQDPRAVVGPWEDCLGMRVPVLEIPGDHFTPFVPLHVGAVTKAIAEACNILEH